MCRRRFDMGQEMPLRRIPGVAQMHRGPDPSTAALMALAGLPNRGCRDRLVMVGPRRWRGEGRSSLKSPQGKIATEPP
jgi:hypothetical protein